MSERLRLNGYTSKLRQPIQLDGQSSCWDLMKTNNAYYIYYSREHQQWLKVPQKDIFENRIHRSLPPQQAALEIAQLHHQREATKIVSVSTNNSQALLIPHLGKTVEATLRDELKQTETHKEKDDLIDALSQSYYFAWLQAKTLLIDEGWWFDDQNPGNIVCENPQQPVLIDFTNKKVRSKPNSFSLNELEGKFLRQIRIHKLREWYD